MSHYYVKNKLHFNATGILVGESEEGTWPTNGLVHVDDLEIKPNLVRIRGTREILTLRTQDGKLGLQPILKSRLGIYITLLKKVPPFVTRLCVPLFDGS